MSSPRLQRRVGNEKGKRGKLSEKSSSFHGKADRVATEVLQRPRTVPDLLAGRNDAVGHSPRLTKLLLNVTIHRILGVVRVVMPPEATVEDLIAAALRQYGKEQRLPVLDAPEYDLHYSQFSLESLDRVEKVAELGSRNFFLCPRTTTAATESGGSLTSRCSKEVDTGRKKGSQWLKFIGFFAVN